MALLVTFVAIDKSNPPEAIKTKEERKALGRGRAVRPYTKKRRPFGRRFKQYVVYSSK